uniref:UDP-GalNAc:beta-1,3-N-acetylgalactosaminyltransferase 2 n=1 Tax=Timema tahoe TaxID=61484 RepID=A0A7R9IIQ1_9NEOP|nr:unnamed protein product [Timema tahoe]
MLNTTNKYIRPGLNLDLPIVGSLVYCESNALDHTVTKVDVWKKDNHLLIIGIMSGQNNSEERQTIRDTWGSLVDSKRVRYYFLVGEQICDVPPEDRVDEFSCEEWLPPSLKDLNNTLEFTSNELLEQDLHLKPLFSGFAFLVHHSVVIQRVTILRDLLNQLGIVKVILASSSREPFLTATFVNDHVINGSLTVAKSVKPHLLHKGFEGIVTFEAVGPGSVTPARNMRCFHGWNLGNGLVTVSRLIPEKGTQPLAFNNQSCVPFTLVYTLWVADKLTHHVQGRESHQSALSNNADKLTRHVQGRGSRQLAWIRKMEVLKEMLRSESDQFEDMMLVDLVDVYRNLPAKLLHFIKRVYETHNFSYILKTDDDTFVDVLQVTRALSYFEGVTPSLWVWSSFKEMWPVAWAGKWGEQYYRALSYPPFPCGAGYVISKGVAQFLATTADKFLYTGFQGEDVAMGIWLAGVNLTRFSGEWTDNDSHVCGWVGDDVCHPMGCNKAQLSVMDMYHTWNLYKQCGNMCLCL